ncbi:hypothetical protein ACFL5K_01685 [Gemmatimonadota bacterium]
MTIPKILFTKYFGFLLVLFVTASFASAQEELVRVAIHPDKTDWDWESYTSQAAGRLASAIERRVTKGLPMREFVRDSVASTLEFRFRVDSRGRLVQFNRLVPRMRYLTYLIRRTAAESYIFDYLPEDFPLFYFDGTVTVSCMFTPTGRYKRFYFEEPLDSLSRLDDIIVLKPTLTTPLLLYEPITMDKKELLEQYKKNLGLMEPITDTSGFTPLSFKERRLSVYVAYDSLPLPPYQADILREEIIRELSEAGASTSDIEYVPEKIIPKESLSPDSADIDEALEAEPSETDSTTDETPASADSIVLHRDLKQAFSTVFKPNFLVFSIGLAPTLNPDTAACRLRLFLSDKPGELKRNMEIKFAYRQALPEGLGRGLVKRLTKPPAKPKPPPKPKPKPLPKAAADSTTAADSTAPSGAGSPAQSTAAAPDSVSSADTTGVTPGDTLGTQSTTPAVTPAIVDSTAAVPPPAVQTDTVQQEPAADSAVAAPEATQVPPDSVATPIDSTAAVPDSTKTSEQQ